MRTRRALYWRPACFSLVTALATAGCSSVPKQTGFMSQLEEVQQSATELRTRAVHVARRIATVIELAADSIRSQTSDPAIRREALLWKTYSLLELQEASLRPDPLLALVDIGAFSRQMGQYYVDGRGKAAFGQYQPIAHQAFVRIRDIGDDLVRAITVEGQFGETGEELRADLRAWVADHPIEGHLDSRASIVYDWAQYLEGGSGIGSAVGSMEQALGRLEDRAAFLNEYMLKQASWQAELAFEELAQSAGFAPATAFLESATALVEGAPDLLASERSALLEDLAEERVAVLKEVDRQLDRALRAIAAEREAVLGTVSLERDAVLHAITLERIAALEEVDHIVDDAVAESRDLIDHLFWRLTQFTLGVGAAGALATILVFRKRK